MIKIPQYIFESDEFQGQDWYQGCAGEINIIPDAKGGYDFAKLNELERSGKYVAEYKGDGNWNSLFKSSDKCNHYSRTRKKKFYPIEHWEELPDGTVLIGEVMRGSQFATKMVEKVGHEMLLIWDILFKDYEPVMQYPASQRRKILENTIGNLSPVAQEWYRIMPRFESGFAKEYADQHEGLVIKPKDEGAYVGCGRKVSYWWKAKKAFESDAVILGYEKSIAATKVVKDLTATIVVGVYGEFSELECKKEYDSWNRNPNYVGCGYADLEVPFQIIRGKKVLTLKPVCAVTANDNALGEKLVKEWGHWKNKVLKVHSFGQFDSGSFRHPSALEGVHALRDDKRAEDCVFEGVKYKLM